MSATAAQLVKWVPHPPGYSRLPHPSANPLANSPLLPPLLPFFFFFLSTDCGTDCNCNCTINHFHLRYKLHRSISVRVLATCCQMLKSPLSLSIFSFSVPLHFPNKLGSSRLYPTQPPVPVPSRSACNAYDAFPPPCRVPLPSQFLDLWPSFEYNYVVFEIIER